LLESVVGGLYPVYPHDGNQVPFDLVQHPERADTQPTVGTADERARRRRIESGAIIIQLLDQYAGSRRLEIVLRFGSPR
jgi:hypothetical protein